MYVAPRLRVSITHGNTKSTKGFAFLLSAEYERATLGPAGWTAELMEMFTCFSCFAAGPSMGPSSEWRLGRSPQRFYAGEGILAGYTLRHPAKWYGFLLHYYFIIISCCCCYLINTMKFPKIRTNFLDQCIQCHSWWTDIRKGDLPWTQKPYRSRPTSATYSRLWKSH